MTFDEKCAAALRLLASTGMSRMHYAPLGYRALWRMGVPIAPPHFSGFLFNALMLGGLFAVTCQAVCLAAWLAGWSRGPSIWAPWLYVALYSVSFGMGMGAVFRYGARKHGIPRWSSYDPSARAPQTGPSMRSGELRS